VLMGGQPLAVVQFVELGLSLFRDGRNPVELFGQTLFPTIGKQPYLLPSTTAFLLVLR